MVWLCAHVIHILLRLQSRVLRAIVSFVVSMRLLTDELDLISTLIDNLELQGWRWCRFSWLQVFLVYLHIVGVPLQVRCRA